MKSREPDGFHNSIKKDNTSLEVKENTNNYKNQNWLLTCDEQYTGLRTLLKS